MKKVILILFVLTAFLSVNAQTTYYVDKVGTGDTLSTIAEINALTLSGSDSVLFKRDSVWRESLTVPNSGTSGSPIIFGAYGSGANPIISGSDVITGMTQYSGNVYQKTSITTQPYIMVMDGVVGELQTSIANCDTAGQWFWDSGTDIFYAFLDTAYGTDLIGGVDFVNDWGVVADATIDDANSFTATSYQGGIALSTSVGSSSTLYEIHLVGTTESTDLRLYNYNSGTNYLSGLTGAFDTTIQVTPTFTVRPRFMDFEVGLTSNTTDITTLTIKEITVDTDALIELGQRGKLIDASSRNYITLENLTLQHSNDATTGNIRGAVWMYQGSYLTVSGCTFKDNNTYGLYVADSHHITVDDNVFLRNGTTINLGDSFRATALTPGITNIVFTNNNVSYSGHNGFTANAATIANHIENITISGNTFNNNTAAGCYTIKCDTVAIFNNHFDNNGNEINEGIVGEDYNYGSEGCNYVDFYDNVVQSTGGLDNSHSDAVQFYSDNTESGHNIRIFRNVIDGTGWQDALGMNMLGEETSDNMEIFSNVIINAGVYSGIGFYKTGTGAGSIASIYNNTFYGNTRYDVRTATGDANQPIPLTLTNNIFASSNATYPNVLATSLTSGLTTSNNLWYTISGNVLDYGGTTYTTSTITTFESTAQNTDPLFTDAVNGDFTLKIGSPAINNGIYVGLTEDILGNPIPTNGGYDIGAYEYQGVFKFMRRISTGKYVTKDGEFVGRTEY